MALDPLLASLLLVSAAAAVWSAAGRIAARFLPATAWSERFLRRTVVATLAVVLTLAGLGFAGALGRSSVVAAAGALWVASRRLPPPARRPLTASRLRVVWPLVLAAALLAADSVVTMPAAPTNWDAMSYHLYLPARWLQEGRILHVPTLFGEESVAYAPQNGALVHAWQMALLGRDATTGVWQIGLLAVMAVAVFRLALLLGRRPRTAAMAAATAVAMPPLRQWAATANVDAATTAFFVVALAASLAVLERRREGSVAVAGLAAGLSLGTKTIAAPLVATLATVVAAGLVARRSWRGLGLFFGGLAVAGGFWYLRNLALYGNPLFPLEVEVLGAPLFRGVYRLEAFRRTYFRVDDLGTWLSGIVRAVGGGPSVLALFGLAGLVATGLGGRQRRRRRLAAGGLAVFALAWSGYVYAGIPANNQARFLAPALVVAVLGWATWLDALRRRGPRTVLFLAGFATLLLAARPDLAWGATLERLAAAGVAGGRWIALAAAALALVGLVSRLPRGRSVVPWLALVLAVPVLAAGIADADRARPAFYAAADYRAWGAGYLLWNDPAIAPHRIAASGFNVPYALMGVGWRHRVVTCETQGEPGDGVYEFWVRAGRPRLGTHKPGLYRGPADAEETWRACLEREAVDTVVLFQTLPVERPAHWTLADGFPIERSWIRARPADFRPLILTERAEIYAVRRPSSPAAAGAQSSR